jgi:hypothetical protein
MLFDFVATDSEGGSPVSVTVADLSGDLADARPATAAELTAEIDRTPMEGGAGGLFRVADTDRTILMIWGSARCDSFAVLTVAPAVTSLTIAPGRPADCEVPWSTYRGVMLTFDRPVDIAGINFLFP